MDITKPHYGSTVAMSTAVKGAQDNQNKFSKAAEEVVKSYAAAANLTSGAELSDETLAAASDPVNPMIDMKASQRAYEATLKVISAVNEMEKDAIDKLA